jgi:hypothetical protein
MVNQPLHLQIEDCSITALEAFFLQKSEEASPIYACIERMSLTCTATAASSPVENYIVYMPEDVKRMIDSDPSSSEVGSGICGFNRERESNCMQRVDVCSVRILYNDVHMFLDRDLVERDYWSNKTFHLSTEQIKKTLSLDESRWLGHLSTL